MPFWPVTTQPPIPTRPLRLDDQTLLDGLARQDPAAARYLHEAIVPSIWRFVYLRVDRADHVAEDIVSETVLALVDAVTAGKQIDYPAAWLRTVATRRVQDHYRAAARVRHLIADAEAAATPQADPLDPSAIHDHKLMRQTVREAMDHLPEDHRLALEWKYVDKLSTQEIADRFDRTAKSVESLLFRARNALRQKLERTLDPPPGPPKPRPNARATTNNGGDASETTTLRTGLRLPDPLRPPDAPPLPLPS